MTSINDYPVGSRVLTVYDGHGTVIAHGVMDNQPALRVKLDMPNVVGLRILWKLPRYVEIAQSSEPA